MKKASVAVSLLCLALTSLVVGTDAVAAGCSPSKTLSCGSVVTDSLSSSTGCVLDTFPTAVYAFNGTAGQTIDLLASDSAGFTIGLTLADSSGKTITSDFDEPASVHATLTATGQYTISVNFGNPHQSGAFTLTTSCSSSTPPPTECFYAATIAIGATVSGQLTASDAVCGNSASYAKVYKLPVNAGDAFEVDYSTVGYQPYISIVGPDTSSGRRWTDYPGTTAVTYYVAPTAGNVSIYAMSNNTTPSTGSFTLKVLPLPQVPCGKTRAVRH